MDADVQGEIVLALRAFGALRKAVFLDRNLRLDTKRKVYQARVLSVLMWHVRKLNKFHYRCSCLSYPRHY